MIGLFYRRPSRWLFVCIITLALSIWGLAAAPAPPPSADAVDPAYAGAVNAISQLIRFEMERQKITGLSIALVDDQEVVWAQGFGYADQAREEAAAPDTIYQAGSISKLMTATVAMQLAEQGLLDIDQPIQTYIPELAIRSRFEGSGPVTARNIMTHHSGIPSDLFYLWEMQNAGTRLSGPVLVGELNEEYLAYPPGFIFSYSNVAMDLLGYAAEKITGQSFPALVEQAVFSPLGMTHSSFLPVADLAPWVSKAYSLGKEATDLNVDGRPCGGLRTSVLDLSRFMKMVFAQGRSGETQILRPATLAEMLRPQNTDVPLDFDFRIGLNWFLSETAGYKTAGHGGDTNLFHSQMQLVPELKLGVVVLTNSSGGAVSASTIAAVTLHTAIGVKTKKPLPLTSLPPAIPASRSPHELKELCGKYLSANGATFEIRWRGSRLWTKLGNQQLTLIPLANGRYALRGSVLGLFPSKSKDLKGFELAFASIMGRQVAALYLPDGKGMLYAERVVPVPIPDAWTRRLGIYEVANCKSAYMNEPRLFVKDGYLMLQGKQMLPLILAPVSDTEAVVRGLGRSMGDTVRVIEAGGEERIRYSGYEFRRTTR